MLRATVSPATRRRRSKPPSEELLRRLRVSLIRKATLSVAGRSEELLIIDVALTGAFIERAEALPVGTAVELTFRLPDNEIPVRARGHVAWCHRPPQRLVSKRLPPGIGVDLTDMADDDRHRLRAFLLAHYQRGPRGRQFMRPWPVTPGAGEIEGASGPALPGHEFAPDLLPASEPTASAASTHPAPTDPSSRPRA
jgi:Tfp pilus assembly protein PilZ